MRVGVCGSPWARGPLISSGSWRSTGSSHCGGLLLLVHSHCRQGKNKARQEGTAKQTQKMLAACCAHCPSAALPQAGAMVANVCGHLVWRSCCKMCSGCPHGKIKKDCRLCVGCRHGKLKQGCRQCSGCPHGNNKYTCRQCRGCPHGRITSRCRTCNPCPHGASKQSCPICQELRRNR